MPVYKNTKIYKIWSPRGPKIYIGSTTKDLNQCLTNSKNSYTHFKNYPDTHFGVSKYIRLFDMFELYEKQNCHIVLLEAKECANITEKNKLCGEYIRRFNCINKATLLGLTPAECKEYKQIKKDNIKNIIFKKQLETNINKGLYFKQFIITHCIISNENKAIKSNIWIAYKKFMNNNDIRALTKKQLNQLMICKFGRPIKNSIDYYYGLSLNYPF